MFERKSKQEKHALQVKKDWFKAARKEPSCERLYVQEAVDIEMRDKKGRTALHVASLVDNTEFMAFLHKHDVNLDVRDIEGSTPLGDAIARSTSGESRTDFAARQTAKFLVSLGADQNYANAEGNTPLHIAISEKMSFDVIREILPDADPTMLNSRGETAAEIAARRNHVRRDNIFQWEQDYIHRREDPAYAAAEDQRLAEEARRQKEDQISRAVDIQWQVTGEDEVTCVTDRPAIGYRLTDIFNFQTQLHTRMAFNTNYRTEGMTLREFGEYTHKQLLEDAAQAYTRIAGKPPSHPVPGLQKMPSIKPS